jgi:hypothetical protein
VLLVVIRRVHGLEGHLPGVGVFGGLNFQPILARVGIAVDPDHRWITIDPGHDHDAVRIPGEQRGLSADTKVLVLTADRLAAPAVRHGDVELTVARTSTVPASWGGEIGVHSVL